MDEHRNCEFNEYRICTVITPFKPVSKSSANFLNGIVSPISKDSSKFVSLSLVVKINK